MPTITQRATTFVRDLVASPRAQVAAATATTLQNARPYIAAPERAGIALSAGQNSNLPPGYGSVPARGGRTGSLPLPVATGNPFAGTRGGLAAGVGVSKPTTGHTGPFSKG
jgi:hypothetical protein